MRVCVRVRGLVGSYIYVRVYYLRLEYIKRSLYYHMLDHITLAGRGIGGSNVTTLTRATKSGVLRILSKRV